jgi:hypothetical protein
VIIYDEEREWLTRERLASVSQSAIASTDDVRMSGEPRLVQAGSRDPNFDGMAPCPDVEFSTWRGITFELADVVRVKQTI